MKLTTVLGSTDGNPNYYKFIPKQISFWKMFNINFIAVFVGNELPSDLIPYKENIILWNKNLNLNTAFVGQNLRIYYTALLNLPLDEMVMITDMDMLPGNENYYKHGLENFKHEDFIYYRHIDKNQIYMCYNAAHPLTWGKVFKIETEDDVEKAINNTYCDKYSGIPGKDSWFTDQYVMYKNLIDYAHLKVLNRPIKRLETWIYKQHINSNNNNFYMLYDDAHFHRSFEKNKELIQDAEKQLNIAFSQ
jgi:hypothetical protein